MNTFIPLTGAALLTLANCATVESTAPAGASGEAAASAPTAPAPQPSKLTLGNGKHNFIILEDATRDGAELTFKAVQISRNGWLVMHPFKDGKPVRNVYVGSSYMAAGRTEGARIRVNPAPQPGARYIVMLHYDMNDDGVFDFGDGVTVPDAPVFEGRTLVAHPYQVPE